MDRAEIVAYRANGEDIFSGMRSNSQIEKKCLAFRGSLQGLFAVDYPLVSLIPFSQSEREHEQ
jgi:hypothetical protein